MLTITAPAAHQRLTTASALRAALAMAGRTPPADEILTAMIDAASAAIAASCQRVFGLETVRETFRPDRAPARLMLARWPVVEIKAVTIAAEPVDLVTVEAEANGVLHHLDAPGFRVGWPSGPIVVTYEAGYILPDQPTPTLPANLQRACIVLAKGWIEDQARTPHIRRTHIEGVMETEYFPVDANGIGADIEAMIAPYRAPATAAWG